MDIQISTNIEKKKTLLRYFGYFLFTCAVMGIAGYFPPVWAMCDCTYNYLKSFMIFPGSLFASAVIMYLTIKKSGSSFTKSYFKNLAIIAIPYALISFFLVPISDTLDSLNLGVESTISIPPRYTQDENSVYLYGKPILSADPLTFKFISENECSDSRDLAYDSYHPSLCYASDKNTIFLDGSPIEESDPATFSINEVSNVYSMDKNNAYFQGKKIHGVDITTFTVIGPWYAKDSAHAYSGGTKIEGVDLQSFRFVSVMEALSLSYAIDKNRLYQTYVLKDELAYADYPKTGDPATFTVLDMDYMKDSKHVYKRIIDERSSLYGQPLAIEFTPGALSSGWVIVPNVDPDTLKKDGQDIEYTLGDSSIVFNDHQLDLDPKTFTHIKDSSYVKDKNKVLYIDSEYISGEESGFQKEVIGADPTTFEFIKTSEVRSHRDKQYAKDKNHVYVNWEVLPNVDPQTLDPSSIPDIEPCPPDEARINGACPNYKR